MYWKIQLEFLSDVTISLHTMTSTVQGNPASLGYLWSQSNETVAHQLYWILSHLPLDKMAAMSQTIFSDAFSLMKIFEFRLKLSWNLFLRVQLTTTQHWFSQLSEAITWTNADTIHWRRNAALGENVYIFERPKIAARYQHVMTSSNGNIFRVTGHLCGNSPIPGEFPAQRPATRSFDIFFDLRLNKRSSKQSWGWWFDTLSHPLWRHCNEWTNLITAWGNELWSSL